jgi:hypothetical protein
MTDPSGQSLHQTLLKKTEVSRREVKRNNLRKVCGIDRTTELMLIPDV